MLTFTVELLSDGKTVERAAIQAENAVEAAETWGPVTIPYGEEPDTGEWVRVTHPDGNTTNWFEPAA